MAPKQTLMEFLVQVGCGGIDNAVEFHVTVSSIHEIAMPEVSQSRCGRMTVSKVGAFNQKGEFSSGAVKQKGGKWQPQLPLARVCP